MIIGNITIGKLNMIIGNMIIGKRYENKYINKRYIYINKW